MNAESMSLSEQYEISLGATVACMDRLKKLARWSDARDESLQNFLQSLLRNEERRLDELNRIGVRPDRPRPRRLQNADLQMLLHGFFPSFYRPLGEGFLDRERGMYLAECLEEESARFYHEMANRVTDPASRTLFLRLEREDGSNLKLVRSTVFDRQS